MSTYLFNVWKDCDTHLILQHWGLHGSHRIAISKSHIDSVYEGRFVAWSKIIWSIILVSLSFFWQSLNPVWWQRLTLTAVGLALALVALYQFLMRSVIITTDNGVFIKQWLCDNNDGELIRRSIWGYSDPGGLECLMSMV